MEISKKNYTILDLTVVLLIGLLILAGLALPANAQEAIHANGELILSPDGTTVFIIENNELFAFRDVAEFRSHKFTFEQVQTAHPADFNRKFGKIKRAATWSLIRTQANPTVYLVRESDVIRPIPTLAVFSEWKFKFADVITVQSLDGYIIGNVLE